MVRHSTHDPLASPEFFTKLRLSFPLDCTYSYHHKLYAVALSFNFFISSLIFILYGIKHRSPSCRAAGSCKKATLDFASGPALFRPLDRSNRSVTILYPKTTNVIKQYKPEYLGYMKTPEI